MEISLLRYSVGALSARRHNCVHCHRTPLIGEVVHIYGKGLRLRAVPASAPRVSGPFRDRALPRARPRSASAPARRLTGAAATIVAAAVDPVHVNVMIDRPRDEVFAYLADVANHSEFSDHYLTNWHLLRTDSVGARRRGAVPRRRAAPALRLG